MEKVVITGVSGAVGQRLATLLCESQAAGPVDEVFGIDVTAPPRIVEGLRFVAGDVAGVDLKRLFAGAEAVVHLAEPPPPGRRTDPTAPAATVRSMTQMVLSACGDASVRHVVLVSSATVYGAWNDNPVPLTEVATLRPNPGFTFAAEKAEVERAAAEWADEHPDARVTVLRPASVAGVRGYGRWLSRTTRPALLDRLAGQAPPVQYLHVDDLAGAIAHVIEHRLAGTFNVAPDSWIPGDRVGALLGPPFTLPVPSRLGRLVQAMSSRSRSQTAQAYRRHPWVVANDHLRATGWTAASTSEEAFVASHPPGRVVRFGARHRQELTLAAVAALGALGLGVLVLWLRRVRRK